MTREDLHSELMTHRAVEGLSQMHSTRRFASLALCELLLSKAEKLAKDDPQQAARFVEMAAAVAEQLDLDVYGAPVVQDSQTVAWAYLGDGQRIEQDQRTAAISAAAAERLIAGTEGVSRLRGRLLTLQASLACYCGRFEEAVGLLNRAATIYRRLGDRHFLGRTLLKKGTALGTLGRPLAAARVIRRSMDLFDPQREPRLIVCATHNYIWYLEDGGERPQAETCIAGARRLYREARDKRQLGRLRWLEGKLASHPEAAESALREARDGLARAGLPYEAALASFDLAQLYAREKNGAAMRKQADQMLPLFRSQAMYRETMVALLSYREGHRETGNLLAELGEFLDRTWHEKNPQTLLRRLSA
jgi:tetratricopeptide (TPR) repeat protein